MAFTIPNEADAGEAVQAALSAVHFQIIQRAIQGNGVWEVGGELAVTAQGTPDNTVAVAEGVVCNKGKLYQVDAANVTITNYSDGTVDEFLLHVVVVTAAGALTYRAGTQAARPVLPALTAGDIALAVILVDSVGQAAGSLDIAAGDITDMRMFVVPNQGAIHKSSIANDYYVNSGGYAQGNTPSSSVGNSDDMAIFSAVFVPFELTFDKMLIGINTLCSVEASGTPVVRLGLYRAGDNGWPDVLVIEADATIDISSTGSTGIIEVAVNSGGTVTIPPGLYYGCLATQDIVDSLTNPKFYDIAIDKGSMAMGDIGLWAGDSTPDNNVGVTYFSENSGFDGALPSVVGTSPTISQNTTYGNFWVALRSSV